MNALLTFCVLFITCAFSAAAAGKLIYFLIQPGELFGKWQFTLLRLEQRSKFLYKRLGGCIICTRQLLADISFIVFCVIYSQYFKWPAHSIYVHDFWFSLLLWVLLDFFIYVSYASIVLTFGSMVDNKPGTTPTIEKEYPHEEIIEQNGL